MVTWCLLWHVLVSPCIWEEPGELRSRVAGRWLQSYSLSAATFLRWRPSAWMWDPDPGPETRLPRPGGEPQVRGPLGPGSTMSHLWGTSFLGCRSWQETDVGHVRRSSNGFLGNKTLRRYFAKRDSIQEQHLELATHTSKGGETRPRLHRFHETCYVGWRRSRRLSGVQRHRAHDMGLDNSQVHKSAAVSGASSIACDSVC